VVRPILKKSAAFQENQRAREIFEEFEVIVNSQKEFFETYNSIMSGLKEVVFSHNDF
jgi:hypothetical protein